MKTKILIFLIAVGILVSLSVNLYVNFYGQPSEPGKDKLFTDISKVAIGTKVLQLDLFGGIFYGDSSLAGVRQIIREVDKAAKDDETKGLFIRANSPGGTIAASQELYEAIKRFRETGKPIITSVMDFCASGCYYATLPSNAVIANRGSLVGSIGVILSTLNMEELYKKIGIKADNIISVKHKDMLSPTRKLTALERAHLQRMVSKMHEDFVSDVVHWRKDRSSERVLRKTANGMIYTTDMALERGLIDKVGDLVLAQEEMAKTLGVDRKDIRFVKPVYRYWEDVFNLQVYSLWQGLLQSIRSVFISQDSGVPQLRY